MQRVFSGIKPSGIPHIGNYLGAIKNWVPLQDEYDCLFCVVDLHALTVYQKPEILNERVKTATKILLTAGLGPEKNIIFIQSHIKEHAELAWIFSTVTPVAELQRMTQYKEKAQKQKANVSAGLLNYPVLMAADILLYHAEVVPVGDDQRQHVELARVIAKKFNNLYGETFKLPQAIIRKEGARIMSLTDPRKKMSKSDEDPMGCVDVTDSPDVIREKIKKAITDSGREIVYRPDKPALANLLTIYSIFANKPIKELEKQYQERGYAEFKKELAEVIVDALAPFQKRYATLDKDPDYVIKILKAGAQKAQGIATQTIKEVKEKIGLI